MKDIYGYGKKWLETVVKWWIKSQKFSRVFFYKISKNRKQKFFAFYAITTEPIKVQTCSASQIDRLNLSFVKDTHGNAKKMARKGGKMVIYELQILRLTL